MVGWFIINISNRSLSQRCRMTLTLIFKVIEIGCMHLDLISGRVYSRVISLRFWSITYYFLNLYWNKTDRGFTWWKYLEDVDFINTKIFLLKISSFYVFYTNNESKIAWPWNSRTKSFPVNDTWNVFTKPIMFHDKY